MTLKQMGDWPQNVWGLNIGHKTGRKWGFGHKQVGNWVLAPQTGGKRENYPLKQVGDGRMAQNRWETGFSLIVDGRMDPKMVGYRRLALKQVGDGILDPKNR